MALSDSRAQQISMLCAMYVAQGLPWGFMANAVVSYITDTDETITDTQTGQLTAMILLPWTFSWCGPHSSTVRGFVRWAVAGRGSLALS